jgi:hypothetical protein
MLLKFILACMQQNFGNSHRLTGNAAFVVIMLLMSALLERWLMGKR